VGRKRPEKQLRGYLDRRQSIPDYGDNPGYFVAEETECGNYCCTDEAACNGVLNRGQPIFFANELHDVLFHFSTPCQDNLCLSGLIFLDCEPVYPSHAETL
jgi:hypothetical protein